MRPCLAAGWELIHVTDRCVELRKHDPAYLRFTGRPGFVRVRAEPGMDRQAVIAKAEQIAACNDEALAKRVVTQLVPSVRDLSAYRHRQQQMRVACATPEDPDVIGVKRP